MPAISSALPSPLPPSSFSLYRLFALTHEVYHHSFIFLIVGILLIALFLFRLFYAKTFWKHQTPKLTENEKEVPRRTHPLTPPPLNNLPRNHPPNPESLPSPNIKQYSRFFSNTVTTPLYYPPANTVRGCRTSPRGSGRRETVHDVNGCRRHVVVWG